MTSNILHAVAATGAGDVWAGGTAKNLFTQMVGGLTLHWDGIAWSQVNAASGAVYGATAVSSAYAWQVGDLDSSTSSIGRWNGSAWSLFPSPAVPGRFFSATALTPCDVWAVGQRYVPDVGVQTLTQRFTCDSELFCFCDAGGACANPDPAGGCTNSTGSGARLFQSGGSASVSSDDLVLSAVQLPPDKLGLFFMGGGTTGVPFLDGHLCVASGRAGLFRYAAQSSGPGGTLTLGPGVVAASLNFPPPGVIQAGSRWHFQSWYRDAAGPCGSGGILSNAASVSFVP